MVAVKPVGEDGGVVSPVLGKVTLVLLVRPLLSVAVKMISYGIRAEAVIPATKLPCAPVADTNV